MLPVRGVFQAAQMHMPALLQACRHLSSATAASGKVGFIGLGHMGNRMVQRLLGAGHEVVAYDSNRLALSRTAEVAKQQGKGSLETRSAPQDLVQDEDVSIIFTMLPNQSAVLKAYLGEQGLLQEGAKVGTSLFVDCSTVNPDTARKLAKVAKKVGLSPGARTWPGLFEDSPTLVDAPVSGGVIGAEAGTLSFMVGGRPAAVDVLRPYFTAMGGHVTRCGGHGTGSAAKLCNTLVLAASMAAVSETLALSKRLGLEFETMTEVLNNSSGRCWSSEAYNPVPGLLPEAPSSKGYKPGMTTDMINEQLQLLIAAAEGARSPVPVARHVKALYDHINSEGLGDKDFSSIFRYVYGQGCDNEEWQDGQQLFSSQIP